MHNFEQKYGELKAELMAVEKNLNEEQQRRARLQRRLTTISIGLQFQRQGVTRNQPVWFAVGQN